MRAVGNVGEGIAETYLRAKGARILQRNWAMRGGEIDLIAELDNVILFVEVKLRRSEKYGSVYESITPAKQKALRRAAQVYLQKNGLTERFSRFDAIFIGPEGDVEHIERAFEGN